MNNRDTVRQLTFLGMMTALVFAGNFARIVIPVPVGGVPSFTLANILCALSGLLLGPVGGLASGLGSAFYDLTNPIWAPECWITFLTKGALGLGAGLAVRAGRPKSGVVPTRYPRFLAGAVAGCLVYYVLYFLKAYFYNGILLGGMTHQAALISLAALIPTSLFNSAVAIVAAPPLAVAIQAALKRAGLLLR
ncbi:MAG: ECF transporter S component [Clostridia bacterium]|nr:ECF transporter S component [Clostridia bacterium]